MADLEPVLADLSAEGDVLDGLIGDLDAAAFGTPTPAAGWTVAHQLAHLAWTDEIALLAATDPDAFAAAVQQALSSIATYVDDAAAEGAALPAAELLDRWRRGRAALAEALRAVPDGTRLPWFGPPMSPTSMATARLMETWAHSGDVFTALGAVQPVTARLRHIAHLAVRTRDFAYLLHDETPPAVPFRIELTAPDGSGWVWGPAPGDSGSAADQPATVTGPALDFCLLATQRIHRADTALVATGPDADHWLDIIQAFAGAPGAGRPAGTASTASSAGTAGSASPAGPA